MPGIFGAMAPLRIVESALRSVLSSVFATAAFAGVALSPIRADRERSIW